MNNEEFEAASELEFVLDPAFTKSLRDEIAGLWTEVVNAGGAVVFKPPPVSREEAVPAVEAVFAAVDSGREHLLVAKANDEVVGWVVIEHHASSLIAHRAFVKRLMVSPRLQGRGVGRGIMHQVHEIFRDELGVTLFWLTCRGGTGLDSFYLGLGYREMGRLPRALRVAPEDYRDETFMFLELS